MTHEQLSVLEFHKKFGLTVNGTPTSPSFADRELRIKLMVEKLQEYIDATSIVQVADALANLQYVLLGTAVSWGIDLDSIFREVHRSNMTKVWPDGTVKKNEFGKVIKPPSYSPAQIKEIILRQAAKGSPHA